MKSEWSIQKLGELCSLSIGKTPSRDNNAYWGDGYPWLSIADMRQGKNLSFSKECITELAIKECGIKLVPKGTLVMSFKLSIGKLGILTKDMYTNEAIVALHINDNKILDRDYLYFALQFVDLFKNTDRAAMGKTLNKASLALIEVPLPPLETQKQIAAILEKADNLRKQCQRVEQELNALAQSVFLEMFGDPVTNSRKWPLVKLGMYTSKIGSGSTPTGGNSAYKQAGISLIRSMNVHNGVFTHKNLAFIDEMQALKLANVQVMLDDVLLNITGASVARVCRVPNDILPARVNQHVMIIRPFPTLNAIFLEHLLLSAEMKSKLLQISETGATREAITKAQVENLEIIYPDIALQNKFSQIMLLIEKQKAQAYQRCREQENLFNSLIQKSFNSDLCLKPTNKTAKTEAKAAHV